MHTNNDGGGICQVKEAYMVADWGQIGMSDTILIAIISSGVALLSSIFTGIISSSKTIYRIDQLERKVEKHNSLVERMVAVEQSAKSAHHRLDKVEKNNV